MGLKPVGAAWNKADKNGNVGLSIKLDEAVPAGFMNAFLNTFKNKENQPDFKLFVNDPNYTPPPKGSGSSQPQRNNSSQQTEEF